MAASKTINSSFWSSCVLNDDRLTCSVITDQQVTPFRKKGGVYKQRFAQTVLEFPEPTMKSSFAEGVNRHLTKGQTVLILMTDALEPIEQLEKCIQRLPKYAGDVRIIQLVDGQERNPSFTGDMELVDSETAAQVHVSMGQAVLEKYKKARDTHQSRFEQLCAKYGVVTIQILVEEGLQQSFFHRLKKANWIQ